MSRPAILAFADGTTFEGTSIGATGQTTGELVFNTSMSGYQEILTDPSYAHQIVMFTVPHVGNVGCNPDDNESNRPWVAGLVVRDFVSEPSSWRATMSLDEFLRQNNIIGIAELDTRYLTTILRERGAQNVCITTEIDKPELAIKAAQQCASMHGMDLAQQVSCSEKYEWQEASYGNEAPELKYHVVAYDFGVKQQILRLLVDNGCRVTVVPAQASVEEVLALQPDGVFLSNGPGDPAACDYAIEAVKKLLAADIPLFGICLGFQILALACGANSKKMKFGHHGANHPVADVQTKNRVWVTSQNHGFVIDEASLPPQLEVTHRSLFDSTLQGIRHKQKPAIGFQGHPESSPGPHDARGFFSRFIEIMKNI